ALLDGFTPHAVEATLSGARTREGAAVAEQVIVDQLNGGKVEQRIRERRVDTLDPTQRIPGFRLVVVIDLVDGIQEIELNEADARRDAEPQDCVHLIGGLEVIVSRTRGVDEHRVRANRGKMYRRAAAFRDHISPS